jgi:hypothetical protein
LAARWMASEREAVPWPFPEPQFWRRSAAPSPAQCRATRWPVARARARRAARSAKPQGHRQRTPRRHCSSPSPDPIPTSEYGGGVLVRLGLSNRPPLAGRCRGCSARCPRRGGRRPGALPPCFGLAGWPGHWFVADDLAAWPIGLLPDAGRGSCSRSCWMMSSNGHCGRRAGQH